MNLTELRNQIDVIDLQILALLRARADVVEQVRAVKGAQKIYIRPGREATMLRALLKKDMGHIPKGLVHRLWREMIGAFTMQEGPMRVAVAGEDLWDSARDHFGSFTPIDIFDDVGTALRSTDSDKYQVVVLPYNNLAWLQTFFDYAGDIQIFYRIPFDGVCGNARGSNAGALLAGPLQPEATGHDRTLIITEQLDKTLQLVELDGFYDSAAIAAWRAAHKEKILRHKIIGAYPVPIIMEKEND